MLDRTALSKNTQVNRIGLFAIAGAAAIDRIVAAVPAGQSDACTTLYVRLGIHAARQNRSSLAHGQACIVAVPELALELRWSVRSVQRRLALLHDAGLIDVHGRCDRSGRALASEYLFRYPSTSEKGRAPSGPETGQNRTLGCATAAVSRSEQVSVVRARPVTEAGPLQAPDAPLGPVPVCVDGVVQPGSPAQPVTPPYVESDETSITSWKDAKAYLERRRRAHTPATDPATNATSGAPDVPVHPVEPAPIPVHPVRVPVHPVGVPVAALAAIGVARSPAGAAPIGSPPDRTGTGSPAAVPPVGAGFPCGPVPAPPRPPERSGRPVRHPVPLASLLGAFPGPVPVVPMRPQD